MEADENFKPFFFPSRNLSKILFEEILTSFRKNERTTDAVGAGVTTFGANKCHKVYL